MTKMTIRDVDTAVRNDGKQPIFVVSRYDDEVCIRLNNLLRSYDAFMQMPVYGLFSSFTPEGTEICFYITVDAPVSVLRAWEEETEQK